MNQLVCVLVQVRNADSSWRDVRKQLRKDQRWDLAESLDREEKEKLFDEHMDELSKKNKEMFHKLLEETSGVSLSKHFLFRLFCIDHESYPSGSLELFVLLFVSRVDGIYQTCLIAARLLHSCVPTLGGRVHPLVPGLWSLVLSFGGTPVRPVAWVGGGEHPIQASSHGRGYAQSGQGRRVPPDRTGGAPTLPQTDYAANFLVTRKSSCVNTRGTLPAA